MLTKRFQQAQNDSRLRAENSMPYVERSSELGRLRAENTLRGLVRSSSEMAGYELRRMAGWKNWERMATS